ncbi:MAG TPA: hypothetical protein VNZ52_09365, partial [Candidatus Thermoplasmatota archaeon]|nr:hypothetical protein [Candidatus Thermoplasmatota archaeon]
IEGRPRPILVVARVTTLLGLAAVGIGTLAGFAGGEIRLGFLVMAAGALTMIVGYSAAFLWVSFDPTAALGEGAPVPEAAPA